MTKIDETIRRITRDISKENSPDSLTINSQTPITRRSSIGDPDCPICHGQGFYRLDVPTSHPEFGKIQVCKCRLKEVVQKVHNKLFEFSNLESLVKFTFENFEPRGRTGTLTDQQALLLQAAYNRCREYAGKLNGWLLISGLFGRGKTHLAAAIANQAVSLGVPTLFLTSPDLLDWMRFAYSDPETTFENRFLEIRNIGLLILDDFGTENATDWAKEKLFQVLNYRYTNQLPVVITTNQELENIEERIQSRLRDPKLVQHIHLNAPDYRFPASAGDHHYLSSLTQHKEQTFNKFDLRKNEELPAQERANIDKVFSACKKYAENPEGWLMLLGDYGTGKTHLAAAIGNYRADMGEPPLLVSVPDLLDHLRATFHPDSRASYDQRFEDIRTAGLLILDDFGMQSSTPWAKEKLYQLFNFRYNAVLPTVITTSQKLEDIDQRLRIRFLDARVCKIYGLTIPSYIGSARSVGVVAKKKK